MGPGHLGIAFAAKTAAPKAPLWSLLVASETLDLLSFGFFAVGLEKPGVSKTDRAHGVQVITPGKIPWSHGLFMSVIWSIAAAALARWVYKDQRASAAIGLTVFSHWLLDAIVHPPDLPLLFDDSPKIGLGLWSSGPGLIISGILEFILLGGGIALYATSRKRKPAGY
ncbi:MAG: hypothetical protein JXB35_01515 [Anaerolineae bacterium]|nr:hypothetical protein [Anaerolineae bacterium]